MKLLAVWDVFSGVAWHRVVIPSWHASMAGHEVRIRQRTVSPVDIEWCDTFYVQRLFQKDALDAIEYAKSLGKLTVCDLDDDLWSLHESNPAYEFWQENAHLAIPVLRAVDRVTTTGRYLAETLARFNPEVAMVPNAVPDDFKRFGGEHEGIVIGWAGGAAHVDDLKLIEDVLLEVLDNRDVTLSLTGCGEWLDHPRIVRPEPVHIDHYHHLLSEYDIGLAPLTDTRFNRAKSDLKPLEYAAVGVPTIASRVGVYAHLSDGVLLAANSKDWRRHLYRLIDDAEERIRLGKEAEEWAKTRRISQVYPKWESAWSSPATTRRTTSPTRSSRRSSRRTR